MPARSIQSYIDETPVWSDGTPLSWAPMTGMQWRIWMLAAAGKFFEGLVVFMTGVAMPLIAEEFSLNRFQHGVVGAASLFGILVGAIGLGGLADRFGRKAMFIVEMIIFMIFLDAAGREPRLLPARPLPVRARTRARVRLSDRPSHHLRKHPFACAGAAGARGVRLSGCRRIGRDDRRLRRAQEHPGDRRVALDVCDRHHSRRAGGARPPHHHRKRALAAGPRPQQRCP